jgi:biotin-dependent carboxylase-like uncharacterized protein
VSAALIVRAPGLFTTVQDRGRHGYRNIGVPTSGALDQTALMLANALVGNEADAAALEILGVGPTLEAAHAPVRVALIGDARAASIERADGTKQPLPASRSARLEPGDRLAIGPLENTFCACLAVEHGFAIAPVLGSSSTYMRGGFGGFEGRILKSGDRLPIANVARDLLHERMLPALPPETDAPIRVVLGPQDDRFSEAGLAAFLGSDYRVTNDADRMGFRLEGAPIDHVRGPDIVSDGAVPGSIQVPGSRQPIVLLADGQSVGGYTKIATIVSADLSRFARMKPGTRLRFAAVTQAEAEGIARAHHAALQETITGIVECRDGVDLEALYRANLVSGVTNAD